ncbi:MAG: hypothetical protein WDN31_16255 [Hyphomicrobium sp.]
MLAVGFAVCPRPACAEAVYEFVTHCRQESLGDCFGLISERLDLLNGDADRRICLPRSFGGAIVDSSVPVSLLEHVRVKLSAARFGHAGSDVNDMIARIINDIYPCRSDRAGLR